MGQAISDIKATAAKQNPEAERRANDSLTGLYDLAKIQNQLFLSTVSNDQDRNKIPIQKIVTDETLMLCDIDMRSDMIAAEIERSCGNFATGDVAKGMGSVLSNSLRALFGSARDNSNQTQKYFIAVGKLGYPLRIDMNLYVYSFTSDALRQVTKNVLIVSATVSSINIATLHEVDIKRAVSYCYGDVEMDLQQRIFDRFMEIRQTTRPGL
ncbi:tyrosine phosphatase protein [Fusarium austroafricanum]|uniref:Tyrosine phosphatase protein n=1 Tax=Fusarium austroafricanum TaxID=2364996 RepID=A0A8H4P0U7_9HYPO|nr:tyrosine phosphatase protein [Fusarium austroafricanum]